MAYSINGRVISMKIVVKFQKERDGIFPLSKDDVGERQLQPEFAMNLARIIGLDSKEWFAVTTKEVFNDELKYLTSLGLSNDFIAEFDLVRMLEDRMYMYPEYFRVMKVINSNVVGDFKRCILVSRKLGDILCRSINNGFKYQEAMEDMIAPKEMEE